MVCRCVAAGCNKIHKDGVSLYLFPKDAALRKKWADQVKRTRDKWEPTDHSVLCSNHFEESCFEQDSKLSVAMGLGKRKPRLKADAVPTLFGSLKRSLVSAEETQSKKARSAYQKRERARIVEAAMHEDASEDSLEESDYPELSHASVCIQVAPESQDVKLQISPATRKIGLQTVIKEVMRDCAIQCSLLPAPPLKFSQQQLEPVHYPTSTLDSSEESTRSESDMSDVDYNIDDTMTSQVNTDNHSLHSGKKYIVFEESLLSLFEKCRKCGMVSTVATRSVGTFLRVTQTCLSCSHTYYWDSQPFVESIPAGNILLSAAILFAGALPRKTLRVLDFFGCASITERTFYCHQSNYLQPSVKSVWRQHQALLFQQIHREKRALVLGGDGRADSPGHSAKFGSYTVMELKKKVVLDMQLVQSNEVKSSYHMEKEGLIRATKFLSKKKFKIGTLVTDRHKQIAKWARENLAATDHRYDIWHVAKSFSKKVDALAREKDCEVVGEWKKSLVNHLYWSAVSTPDGDGEVIEAKWRSLDNHIHNKHRGHSKIFPACKHRTLKAKERNKKWFKPHTKASEKISALIQKKVFCSDIAKLSPVYQTASCEAFHSVVINFAPKFTAFCYNGMLSRLYLAALHYNENCLRKQAETKEGVKRYAILYPKYKAGGHVVRKLLEDCTYGYVEELFTKLWEVIQDESSTEVSTAPPPLSSSFEQPVKEEAIIKHKSRFSQI